MNVGFIVELSLMSITSDNVDSAHALLRIQLASKILFLCPLNSDISLTKLYSCRIPKQVYLLVYIATMFLYDIWTLASQEMSRFPAQ